MHRTLALGLAACGGSAVFEPQTYEFGPYALAPGQEISGQCVSVTLHNEQPLYINAVELTTGPGFHHSNWFWVPDYRFDGPDGTWRCSDRGFDDAVAGIDGGVLFAQSTQALNEKQQFPDGMAIVVPPHSRILSGTHLLNTSDETLSVDLSLTVTPVAEPATVLAAMSFTNDSLALPPHRQSRFTIECDLDSPHRAVLGRPLDFSIVYALAHYHDLGTGITLEALRDDGSASLVFETTTRIGDALGGVIDPGFSLAGYSKLRFSCNYDNPGDTTVRWGLGSGEMCTFLAFTDSDKTWGGGVLTRNEVPTIVDHGTYVEYTYACQVFNSEPNR